MAKAGVWKTDWFLGVAVVCIAVFSRAQGLIPGVEPKAYGSGVATTPRAALARASTPDATAAPTAAERSQIVVPREKVEHALNTGLRLTKAFARAGGMVPMMPVGGGYPTVDMLSIRPVLPLGLVAFLDMAVAKGADARRQSGDEFSVMRRTAFGGAAAAAPGSGGVDIDISL